MLRDIVNKVREELIKESTSDDDGNNINTTSLKESSTSITSGLYNGPTELGLKKWKKSELGPFYEFVETKFNHNEKQKTLKSNIKKNVGVWEKNNNNGSYNIDTHDVDTVKENSLVSSNLRKLIVSVLRESF